MVTRNAEKNLKFSTFDKFLGPFSENLCFRKMCVAGMKRGPCPTILYSFFTKLNEEALLKVSLKNLHLFQSYPFFKNTAFSKMALKIYQKLKNLIFFSAFMVTIFIWVFNGILHVLILLIYPEKLRPLLLLNFIRPPL